jgi:glyoxylase-like metal-dependent hydrolase (beta-lactamase superfamily II)
VTGDLMRVNSYLVVGPTGAVVVDGQLTISDAGKVRRQLEACGVPFAGVVITHGHPDHYAGIGRITAGTDVPIVASAEVDDVIRTDDLLKDRVVGPMLGPEWPQDRVFPNTIVEPGDSVHLGGVTLDLLDIGPAESRHDTIWRLDGTSFFVGDLAYNGMHAYLQDGLWQQWLDILSRLERELPRNATLYVGHGEPGGRELLAAQRRYIESFVAAVRDTSSWTPEARRAAVVERMTELLPTQDLLFLMELSIEPAAAALRWR